MLLIYSIISIILCSTLIIYTVYRVQLAKQIRQSIYPGKMVFIKEKPNKYHYINSDKKIIKNIYPFFNDCTWSQVEKTVLMLDRKQSVLCKYDEELYTATIRRIKYFDSYALLIDIVKFSMGIIKEEEKIALDNISFIFMIIDESYNIVYKNKQASQIKINNLFHACQNKSVLKAAVNSMIPNHQIIKIEDNDKSIRYIDISFYPKTQYGTNKMFWFLFCYDVTEFIMLKKVVRTKSKILDILKTSVYNLFTVPLLDKSIYNILYELGTCLSSQRAYIYRLYKNQFTLEYEWKDLDIQTEDNIQIIEKDYIIKFIKNKIEPTLILKEYIDPNRQEVWEKIDLNSKVITPLFTRDGTLWGIIGFDSYNVTNKVIDWNDEELRLVRLIAVTLNAIMILQADEQQIKHLNIQINEILKTLSVQLKNEIKQTRLMNELLKENPPVNIGTNN